MNKGSDEMFFFSLLFYLLVHHLQLSGNKDKKELWIDLKVKRLRIGIELKKSLVYEIEKDNALLNTLMYRDFVYLCEENNSN